VCHLAPYPRPRRSAHLHHPTRCTRSARCTPGRNRPGPHLTPGTPPETRHTISKSAIQSFSAPLSGPIPPQRYPNAARRDGGQHHDRTELPPPTVGVDNAEHHRCRGAMHLVPPGQRHVPRDPTRNPQRACGPASWASPRSSSPSPPCYRPPSQAKRVGQLPIGTTPQCSTLALPFSVSPSPGAGPSDPWSLAVEYRSVARVVDRRAGPITARLIGGVPFRESTRTAQCQ
jgi:hypothetical protein